MSTWACVGNLQGMRGSILLLLFALLSATAWKPEIAYAQFTARECVELVRGMTSATQQQDGPRLVGLARRRLTYCAHLMDAADTANTLGSLAQGLNLQKNYQEALRVAERCLSTDPSDLFCFLQKGRALVNIGRTDEAFAALDLALKLPAITEFDVTIKNVIQREFSDIVEGQIQSASKQGRSARGEGNYFDRFDEKPSGDTKKFITAVTEGDLNVVRKFLAEGMSANTTTPIFGMPVLHLAQTQNRTEVMKLLIQHGARLNDKFGPSERTALHDAALGGRLASVQVLLEAGADVNAINKFGRTPLYLTLSPPLPLRSPHNASQIAALLREFGGK